MPIFSAFLESAKLVYFHCLIRKQRGQTTNSVTKPVKNLAGLALKQVLSLLEISSLFRTIFGVNIKRTYFAIRFSVPTCNIRVYSFLYASTIHDHSVNNFPLICLASSFSKDVTYKKMTQFFEFMRTVIAGIYDRSSQSYHLIDFTFLNGISTILG